MTLKPRDNSDKVWYTNMNNNTSNNHNGTICTRDALKTTNGWSYCPAHCMYEKKQNNNNDSTADYMGTPPRPLLPATSPMSLDVILPVITVVGMVSCWLLLLSLTVDYCIWIFSFLMLIVTSSFPVGWLLAPLTPLPMLLPLPSPSLPHCHCFALCCFVQQSIASAPPLLLILLPFPPSPSPH